MSVSVCTDCACVFARVCAQETKEASVFNVVFYPLGKMSPSFKYCQEEKGGEDAGRWRCLSYADDKFNFSLRNNANLTHTWGIK